MTLASHISPAARKASRWQAQSKGLRRDTAGLGASGVETLWAKGTQERVGRGKMEPGSVPQSMTFRDFWGILGYLERGNYCREGTGRSEVGRGRGGRRSAGQPRGKSTEIT